MDLLWFSIIVTIVFAAVTGYYAYETRRIRQETIRPNLSLRTGMYTYGGGVGA
jgi:tellurite resistance protein TehA-like permease